jgi:hypothetical protein
VAGPRPRIICVKQAFIGTERLMTSPRMMPVTAPALPTLPGADLTPCLLLHVQDIAGKEPPDSGPYSQRVVDVALPASSSGLLSVGCMEKANVNWGRLDSGGRLAEAEEQEHDDSHQARREKRPRYAASVKGPCASTEAAACVLEEDNDDSSTVPDTRSAHQLTHSTRKTAGGAGAAEVQVWVMEQDSSASAADPSGTDVETEAEAGAGSAADIQGAGPAAAPAVSGGAAASAFTRVNGRDAPLRPPAHVSGLASSRSGSGPAVEEDRRCLPLPPPRCKHRSLLAWHPPLIHSPAHCTGTRNSRE